MKPGRAVRAFTLLELLVATAIAVLFAGLLLAVIIGTLDSWRRSQSAFTSGAQAQLVFDLLERDLQAAIFRPDGGTWLAVDVVEDLATLGRHGWLAAPRLKPAGEPWRQLLGTSPDAAGGEHENARFGRGGAWLRFVTTNVETAGSLPVVVSYQIARRPVSGPITADNAAPIRYTLYRAVVSAEQTWAKGCSVDASAYASTATAPTGSRAPATVANPNNVDALAANVIDFGVWLYARNADGALRRVFPAGPTDLSHAARRGPHTVGDGDLPVVADVMLRLVSEDGAQQLESIEKGLGRRPAAFASDGDWWWSVAESHSRTLVCRIDLQKEAP